VFFEGILELTDEVLVLAGVGDEDVCHGRYSPGTSLSCTEAYNISSILSCLQSTPS
jgi:hypothetical protein